MKRMPITVGLLVVAFFLATASIGHAEVNKVGILNIRLVFDNYQKTIDYDKVLEDQYAKYEAARGEKVEQIQEKQGKLSLLQDDEKKKAEEELQNMISELQDYDREQQTDLTKRRDERIREIMLEIEQYVADYAEKAGFDFILNSNVLIWQSSGVVDISEDIVTQLNATYSKSE